MSAEVEEAAARWHVAQASDAMDWAAFTAWLEADPRHRKAYDAIALLDGRIEAARPSLLHLLAEEEPARATAPVRRIAGWSALAAAVLAIVALGVTHLPSGGAPEVGPAAFTAPAGASRTVRLADGSRATLAPGARLRVSGQRDVTAMLQGSAFFEVRHDPGRTFIVQAGAYQIRDLGTKFDVSSADGMVRVAVAEGEVSVRAAALRGDVTLGAGKALLVGGALSATIAPVRPQSVSAWQGGSLVYEGTPLGLVVSDISQATGARVTIDRALAARPFSGVIARGDRTAMTMSLAQLTGLQPIADGDAIRLSSAARR